MPLKINTFYSRNPINHTPYCTYRGEGSQTKSFLLLGQVLAFAQNNKKRRTTWKSRSPQTFVPKPARPSNFYWGLFEDFGLHWVVERILSRQSTSTFTSRINISNTLEKKVCSAIKLEHTLPPPLCNHKVRTVSRLIYTVKEVGVIDLHLLGARIFSV